MPIAIHEDRKLGNFGNFEANLGEGGQNLVQTGFCSHISARRALWLTLSVTSMPSDEHASIPKGKGSLRVEKFEPNGDFERFREISSAENL